MPSPIYYYVFMVITVITFKVILVSCEAPPNVILILTDDQDVVLDGMTPMQNTQKLLANLGVTFTNAFTSSPICCPSRASILTGQYAHNHATINNSISGGCYGKHWRDKMEIRSLAVMLQNKGYETFYAGKYLNQYMTDEVPPGWNQWFGLNGNSKYYNFTLTENGVKKLYDGKEYLTDVIKTHSLNFLSAQNNDKPFFAMIAPPAPHAPYTPAERHKNAYEHISALRTPNFNVPSDMLEKHWLLRMPPATLPDNVVNDLDIIFRKRWQSLLAVDELVGEITERLNETKLIDNTYIIFTSDNGYHIGQFAQAFDKRQPYETDIRVPFIVRGPNIKPKSIVDIPVILIDIFPTILDLADIQKPDYLDGQSFIKHLKTSNNEIENIKRQILIEYWGEGNTNTYNPECNWHAQDKLNECSLNAACHCQDSWNNTYTCLRHLSIKEDLIYCEFKDDENFVEAYDLIEDSYQLNNLGFSMLPSEHTMYSLALGKLEKCMGDTCRRVYYYQ